MTANEVIQKLGLIPLPEEGGFYRETFRDDGVIPGTQLRDHDGDRRFSTCIYYLITPEEFSGLHSVKSAEIFHFYVGDPVEMIQISQSSQLQKLILGNDLDRGHRPQVIVPPNVWQGTKLLPGGKWTLLGCTVAPGFEFSDFKGGSLEELSKLFPAHKGLISEYTHC